MRPGRPRREPGPRRGRRAPGRSAYLGRPSGYWVRALADPNALVRRLAAYALGEIGPAAPKAVARALTRALEDEASFVRVWAAAALAKVDPLNPRSAVALAEGIRDGAPFVRSLSAWHLGRIGPALPGVRAVVPRVEALLADPDPSVRAEAGLALKGLGGTGVRRRG